MQDQNERVESENRQLLNQIEQLTPYKDVHQSNKEQIENLGRRNQTIQDKNRKLQDKLQVAEAEKISLHEYVQVLEKDKESLNEEKENLLLR